MAGVRGSRLSRASHAALAACVVSISIGCADSADRAQAFTVRDSAGVRIVESLEPSEPNAVWRPSATPLVRIGWEPSDLDFQNVPVGAFLTNGGFVVADEGNNLLYRFSPDGQLVSTFGGRGQGPGEFTEIAKVLPLGGDSLLVHDPSNARVSLFVGDAVVADWPVSSRYDGAFYTVQRRTQEGAYNLVPFSFPIDGEAVEWRSYPLLRATADFSAVDTVAEFDFIEVQRPGMRSPIHRFGIHVNAGRRNAYARMDRPEVTWLDGQGSPVQIARWNAEARDPDEEDWTRYETWYREIMANQDPRVIEQRLQVARGDLRGPIPYFGLAHADEAGNVWLSAFDIVPRVRPREFLVLTADGTSAHTVEFPEGLRVLDISADRVLAVAFNDLEVQAVVVYGLQKEAR